MPRVIVMSMDHEPLTVVTISQKVFQQAIKERDPQVRLWVPKSFAKWVAYEDQFFNVMEASAKQATYELQIVTLSLTPIYKGSDLIFWYATPDSEELALLLRAAFLPGQVTEVRRREALAFFQGVIS